MNAAPSPLSGQNTWLRLLVLILALTGAVDATLRQTALLIVLFFVYLLFDRQAWSQITRAARVILPFLAGYWLFATLLGTGFVDMVLFSLKLILMILVTVGAFGSLTLPRALSDTRGLQKHAWGRQLLRFGLATGLFIRAYANHFQSHKIRSGSSLGQILESLIQAGKSVSEDHTRIEARLDHLLDPKVAVTAASASANLLGWTLIAVMVAILSL